MQPSEWSPTTGNPTACEPVTTTRTDLGMDYLWPLLAINPFVLVADSTPQHSEDMASVETPLQAIQVGVRLARANPVDMGWDSEWCNEDGSVVSQAEYNKRTETTQEDLAGAVWPYGFVFYVIAGGLALFGAERRIRTPVATLAKGCASHRPVVLGVQAEDHTRQENCLTSASRGRRSPGRLLLMCAWTAVSRSLLLANRRAQAGVVGVAACKASKCASCATSSGTSKRTCARISCKTRNTPEARSPHVDR